MAVMSFVSWEYPFFLLGMVVLYWLLPQTRRVALIAIGSYAFYAAWDIRFVALMMTTTIVDFLCGAAIRWHFNSWKSNLGMLSMPLLWLIACKVTQMPGHEVLEPWLFFTVAGLLALICIALELGKRAPEEWRSKYFVGVSLLSNLSILGFFKYYGFFTDSAKALLDSIGFSISPFILEVILPVGISFYTFQSISYVIDVYRAESTPRRNLIEYAAYLSFFPQLVAGPIERSTTLMPQILEERECKLLYFQEGARLFLVGLFKKIYVGDNCAIIANYVFSPERELNAPLAILGVVAFAFQIYGDFSGYSDMARGSARFFGITLNQNFRYPYLSATPSDFWQRWHISLSSWFRDYVYIPLGGNRSGWQRTLINLGLTMLLAGLWHGAAWTFVAWGAYHGLLLIIYRLTPGLNQIDRYVGKEDFRLSLKVPAILLMWVFICLGWAMFRSPDWAVFLNWCSAFTVFESFARVEVDLMSYWLLIHIGPLILLQLVGRNEHDESRFGHYPWWGRGLIYLLMIILVITSARHDQEFIYFQF